MPQITVNEIDQSVVTRVVTDDKVKVLCPIIASFGPGFDGTQDSVKTFTDVTDFNRSFGYTYAEFNPFDNDKSRMYARELIKRGAAVSVVRVNNAGYVSSFDIGPTDRSTPSYSTVCHSAFYSGDLISKMKSGTTTNTNLVPGTVSVTYTSGAITGNASDYLKDGNLYDNSTQTKIGTVNYLTGSISATDSNTIDTKSYLYIDGVTDWTKYTFAPQILGITAKYSGSFGNNIAISIAQINTTRLAESYQYASISVYYVDKQTNYMFNEETSTASPIKHTINSVTLLENKLVSTNPDSPDYFEDVEFDFIKIIASESARSELSIVWSNINANPTSSAQYSGFPVIPLRYTLPRQYAQTYNFSAFFNGGADFNYSTGANGILPKLQAGFKGYWASSDSQTSDGWTVNDVNQYLQEVYGDGTTANPGIISNIYESITECYNNFTDPYIYDFDFITSSGFTYTEYELGYTSVTENIAPTTSENNKIYTIQRASAPGTISFRVPVSGSSFVNCVDDGNGKIVTTATPSSQYGTVVYTPTTTITLTQTGIQDNAIDITYGRTDIPKSATIKVPITASSTDSETSDDVYTAYYDGVTPIHQSMLNLVNTRQDCIALFDLPRDYDKTKVIDYSLLLNTSYGTIHHPWCWINSPDIAGKQIIMAPSYIFLYTFLSNLINNVESQKWFPPAGVERATARVVVKPDYEIGSVILNDWQNDNISRVNPIMRLKQYGYVIYGQYTTLPAIDMYTHSALESLNVRLIANVVKKKIFDTCMNLAFEPNTSALWLKFFAQLDPFLRYMKYNDGLYDYRIVMDSSTVTTDAINHLRCPGKVYIAPTRTAEFFDIDFIITDAGAVFSD